MLDGLGRGTRNVLQQLEQQEPPNAVVRAILHDDVAALEALRPLPSRVPNEATTWAMYALHCCKM